MSLIRMTLKPVNCPRNAWRVHGTLLTSGVHHEQQHERHMQHEQLQLQQQPTGLNRICISYRHCHVRPSLSGSQQRIDSHHVCYLMSPGAVQFLSRGGRGGIQVRLGWALLQPPRPGEHDHSLHHHQQRARRDDRRSPSFITRPLPDLCRHIRDASRANTKASFGV